jgi:DNA helicase-2/ATP-dependent DNA helicase PcrA
MNSFELTPEQECFAHHDAEAFVEACPGAGKTRTVVARLASIGPSLALRRGVAVLSYTNSAVEEFTERCSESGLTRFLRHPSYVGTFDAFVRHFLIMPMGIAASQERPIIVDSWNSLGIAIRLSGSRAFAGDGVSLDFFDPTTNVIDPTRIGHTGLQTHVRQNKTNYEQAASATRQRLLRTGHLSAGDARVAARERVRDPSIGDALGRALAARFHEIIIDEAQDCNPLDLEILAWLRQHGLRMSIVCDLDQAIYGFRHGSPADLRAFAEDYNAANRLALSGNFRSTNPICALAATLRTQPNPDRAVGCSAAIDHRVIILKYNGQRVPSAIGRVFVEHIESPVIGLSRAKAIILAHSRKVAQSAAGDPMSRAPDGTSKIECLARAVGAFSAPSATSRSRDEALREVEKLLLEYMGKLQGYEHPSRALKRNAMNTRIHRRHALQLLMSLPKTCSDTDLERTAWIISARDALARLGLECPQGMTVPRFFRQPPQGEWSRHLQAPITTGIVCATVHEAKGREYDAVCVVLQPDRATSTRTATLMAAWGNRTDDEAKRVIYVGVTRAKLCVMLAVPVAVADQCVGILKAANIPCDLVDLENAGTTLRVAPPRNY